MVEIVLLSVFVGLFGSLIISRHSGGFLPGLGAAYGSVLVLAGVAAWIAWGLADISPTINSHELKLMVEVRLPKGAERPPVLKGKQFVWFQTGPRFGPARAREAGDLDTANARFEDRRWIIPGSVHIFTTRNSRTLAVAMGDKLANGFELHFPGHPGAKHKQWSPWLPDAEIPKCPDSEMSYRVPHRRDHSGRDAAGPVRGAHRGFPTKRMASILRRFWKAAGEGSNHHEAGGIASCRFC